MDEENKVELVTKRGHPWTLPRKSAKEWEIIEEKEVQMALSAIITRYESEGIKYEIFENGHDVMMALAGYGVGLKNTKGEEVDIFELIKNKDFRFIALDEIVRFEMYAQSVTRAYGRGHSQGRKDGYEAGYKAGFEKGKPLSQKTIELGKQKRIENADDHAKKMYELMQNIDDINDNTSLREAARILNDKRVPTARGGQWHAQTLQDLFRRWKALGLNTSSGPQ